MVVAAAASDSATILFELGLVLVGLAVAGRLAGRLGLSPIPLYLLAGLGLGEGGVIEVVTARDFVETGAQIGIVLLLLMLGLEYSGRELLTSVRRSAPAGVLDIVANFTPGVVAGFLFGWGPLAAMFLGGVTYISSSGIIAKTLDDLGRVGNRETPAILSILVIEDLVMALYLPVAAGLLVGAGTSEAVLQIAVAVAAVSVAMVVAIRYGERLSRLMFNPSNELLLLSILGVALLVAGSAERVGAPAAVAAFLVGISISGEAAERARALLAPLRDLFAAVFFVFFGLEIDPATIVPALPRAAGLALVTAGTKLLTGWWAARRSGVGVPGRVRAGAALVARGEFSIIIAGLAVAEGLEADLGPLAACYVLLLAVLGPILTRLAGPGGFAVERALAKPARSSPDRRAP